MKFRFFPVSYDVGDKPVLVIGEGQQALQKLRLLTRTTARLTLFAANPDADLAAFAKAEGVVHVARAPMAADLTGAALVFIATGAADADAALARSARDSGARVNVVDRPALSDFATPAIVDRAPISIAIATDGHAPVLALKLRGAIEAMLNPHFGRLGALAAEVRARAQAIGRLPDASARRGYWARLFDGPAAEAALDGDHDRAVTLALALAELDSASPAPSKGRAFLIDAGPGDADLLTLRAHRLLLSADVVLHDGSVPDAVVAMARRDADRIALPSSCDRADALLTALVRQGKRVARLTIGAPTRDEILRLRKAGVAFDIVPGVPDHAAHSITHPLREAA